MNSVTSGVFVFVFCESEGLEVVWKRKNKNRVHFGGGELWPSLVV